MKTLTKFLILICSIIATQSVGQTGSDICLTPKEYRFYAGALIDKQILVKNTERLDSVITGLRFEVGSLESSLDKCDVQRAKMGEKEAIYTHSIDLLQDDVDKFKKKTVRNRRMVVVATAIIIVETLGIFFAVRLKL